MTRVSQLFDKTAAGFTFYRGYISVVYGLIATDGLEQLGTIDKLEWQFRVPPRLLLFLGVFVIGLHFWFICSVVDDSSHDFYRALAGDKWAHLFFFTDAIFATGLAWLVLAMFHGISSPQHLLFSWLLVASAVSVAYDLYSGMLVGVGRKMARGEDQRAFISRYGATVKYWLVQDSSFFLGGLLLFEMNKENLWTGRGLSICFVLVSIAVLVLDVQFLSVSSLGDKPAGSTN